MMISEKFKQWITFANMDKALLEELKACEGDAAQIEDRFYRDLEFGTGGLRGVIGAGTNRMNVYTVAKATRGFAAYLKEEFAHPSCAIAYDSRNMSDVFSHITAATLAHEGVKVYLYSELMPTPMLSFAVRHLHTAGGVVITASHNPAKYNGYKVYGPDGCQITLEAAERILSLIHDQEDLIESLPNFDALLDANKIEYISGDVIEAYYAAVRATSVREVTSPLKVVYSPLNGAGNKPVRHILSGMPLLDVTVVPQQELPDGNFPTCPYPNPEIKETMALAGALAASIGADICLATDPDCDRVGVGIPRDGETHLITGNEMGAMLFEFICKQRIANGTMPAKPVAVKTIVTTQLATAIAKKYGVELRNVLTGFKFIGEQIGLLEKDGEADRYIFGFEESYGYLSGSFVRDKDAVNASLLICQMAAYYKEQGMSLLDALDQLYKDYGYYKSDLLTFAFEGAKGMDNMRALMNSLREPKPSVFAGRDVVGVIDYERDQTGLPASNVIALTLSGSAHVVVRPSGTEPKLKLYLTALGSTQAQAASVLASMADACNAWAKQ